ncbi:hypothetical protein WP12_19960 [Sphingomonas sp. SRS2]|nr:hypothetical protein WP12_19960 [Sphingomonas sp. SRS2]
MDAAIGRVVGETIAKGGACGRIRLDLVFQLPSSPGEGFPGPLTPSGLRTALQGLRIDQAGRYGLVAGFLFLRALGVPCGGISEAGAHIGHQVPQRAETGKHPLDIGIEVGEEAMRLGSVSRVTRTTSSRGRRVRGRVELGGIELAGRGIVATGPQQATPLSAI